MSSETSTGQEHEQRLASFIEQVSKADGRLIPLSRHSRSGEPLIITARYGEDVLQPGIGLRACNIDVLAIRNGVYVPVGYKDYYIEGMIANGNKNAHQHLPAMNEAHQIADQEWHFPRGFQVRDETDTNDQPLYRGDGIGKLMFATSFFVLDHAGLVGIDPGALSPAAREIWRQFGHTGEKHMEIDTLLAAPTTKVALKKFV